MKANNRIQHAHVSRRTRIEATEIFKLLTAYANIGILLVMANKSRVVVSSGNVFADLGYANSAEHQIKARLVSKIAARIKQLKLNQAQAAKKLSIDQPKISAMLRGHFRGFSVYRLMQFVSDLGNEVEIIIKDVNHKTELIPVHAETANA